MSGAVTVSEDGIVTGNTYDKYGSTNPLVRRLMSGFERALDELFDAPTPARCSTSAAARGCSSQVGAAAGPERRVVGIDLEEESIQAGWDERAAPNLLPGDARREPSVRRRGVRSGHRDRGARARSRP